MPTVQIPAGFEIESTPAAPAIPEGFEIESAPPVQATEKKKKDSFQLPLAPMPIPRALAPSPDDNAPPQTMGMYGVPLPAPPPEEQIDAEKVARGTLRNLGQLLRTTGSAALSNPEIGGQSGAPLPTPKQVQAVEKTLDTPLVPLAEGAQPGTLMHGMLSATQSLTTPKNVALLAGTTATGGLLGGIARGLEGYNLVAVRGLNVALGGYFTAQAVHGLSAHVIAAKEAWEKGDYPAVAEHLGQGSVSALFAWLGAKHVGTSLGDVLNTAVPKPALKPDVLAPEVAPEAEPLAAAPPPTVDVNQPEAAPPEPETAPTPVRAKAKVRRNTAQPAPETPAATPATPLDPIADATAPIEQWLKTRQDVSAPRTPPPTMEPAPAIPAPAVAPMPEAAPPAPEIPAGFEVETQPNEQNTKPAEVPESSVAPQKLEVHEPDDIRESREPDYPNVVTVDARKLKQAIEDQTGEPLAWNPARAAALHGAESYSQYPTLSVENGRIGINDGGHRIAEAARQGKLLDVALDAHSQLPDSVLAKDQSSKPADVPESPLAANEQSATTPSVKHQDEVALHPQIAPYFRTTAPELTSKPVDALKWVRGSEGRFVRGAIDHPEYSNGIGLLHGEPGDPNRDWKGGFGVSHMDAKRPGHLDDAIHILPSLPVIETITDRKTGRVLGKVHAAGNRRAVVSMDLRGHATPEWLLTEYEPPASATSSRVDQAPADDSSGPTPPETGAHNTSIPSETRPAQSASTSVPEGFEIESQPASVDTNLPHPKMGELVTRLHSDLSQGIALRDTPALTKLASEILGDKLTSGKYEIKDLYDALETAVNQMVAGDWGKRLVLEDPRTALAELNQLQKLLPTQTARTETQRKFQQFSTPPTLSYLAVKAAGIREGEVVLEPSAGTGSLAAFSQAAGAVVETNELDPGRAAFLELQGYTPSSVNAERIADHRPDLQPDLVVMNPPFSATAGRKSTNKNSVGYQHVLSALDTLPEGGRLVAILGRGASFDHVTAAPFWKSIQQRGATVRANVGLDGSNYAKYGTTFDNRLIIVDKAKVEGTPVVGTFTDLAEAYDALRSVIYDRRPIPSRDEEVPAHAGVPEGGDSGGSGASHPGQLQESGNGDGSRWSGRGKSGKSPVHVEPAGPGGDVDPTAKPRLDVESNPPVRQSPSRDDRPDRTPERPQPFATIDTSGELPDEAADEQIARLGAYQSYRPQKLRTGISHEKATGTGLVESAAMGAVESPNIVYSPRLPKAVIESGHITNAQLEAITYAGQAHAVVLPNGVRAGFMVGDGTGVGKGTEAAGIAADNWNQGRKRILWLSLKPTLIKQAQRDLDWVESGIKARLLNDWGFAEDIDHEGVLFGTYAMLHRASSKQGEPSRLDQIVKWNPDVILMDESHAAKNAVADGSMGEDDESGRGMRLKGTTSKSGEAVLDLDRRLPDARLTYFSATAFTDTKNLGYATRLGLWGPGTSFPGGFKDFLVQIDRGGMGAMELVAKEMKATGRYLARQISFEGVEYREVTAALTKAQREMYDVAVDAWQRILANIDVAVNALAGKDDRKSQGVAKMQAISQFWGTNQRFYRNLITAMKIPTVIAEIEGALERGNSVFIDLVSTGGAEAERQMTKALAEDLSFDELDMSAKQSILNYLDNSFPVNLMEDYTDENGTVRSRPVLDAKGNPVQSQEALRLREELKRSLDKIQLPQAPLDQLIDYFGADAIAEVSGRKSRIVQDQNTGKPVEVTRVKPKGAAAKDVNDWERQQFQSGKKRIAVASSAGGTGFDFHSDKRGANQQRRTHIVLEPSWSADQQMQKFGRTHRTNQANAPEYVLVASDLGGEKRFIAAIASRIASLGALTRGERKAGGGGADMLAKYNLMGKYGEAAVQTFFKGLSGNAATLQDDVTINIPKPPLELQEAGAMRVCRLLGVVSEGKDGPSVHVPQLKVFMNRVLNLPTDIQGATFNYFIDLFETILSKVKEAGAYDEGTVELKALHSEIVRRDVIRRSDTGIPTNHLTVQAEFPAEKNTWEDAYHHLLQGDQSDYNQRQYAGLYRNKRSGKLWMARRATKDLTDQATGNVLPTMVLIGPDGGSRQSLPVAQLADTDKYERIHSPKSQEKAWNEALAALPDVRKEEIHLITGSVLPVWKQLAASGDGWKIDVVNIPESNGRSVTGIRIPADQIHSLVSAMSGGGDNAPAMILNRVWRQGERVNLQGASLQASRVMGERAIVVQPGTLNGRATLDKLGLKHVETASSVRYYIPYSDDPSEDQQEETLKLVTQVLDAFPVKLEGVAAAKPESEPAATPETSNYEGAGIGSLIAPHIEKLLGGEPNGEPERTYSGMGAMRSKLVRNLSQLEEASPEAHRAAVRAASSTAQASALMRAAMPVVMDALNGKLAREQFFSTMIESRLLGTKQRWLDLADQARQIPKKELVDWALAGPLQVLDSMSEAGDLAQRAAALANNLQVLSPAQTGRNALGKLRSLLAETFEEAAESVHSMMSPQEFADNLQLPEFQAALQVYKRLIEPVLAESHASNEGVFSKALGPLATYFPLVPIRAEDQASALMGERKPFKKPSNIANQFTTGLSADYDTSSEALSDRITTAFRVNDKAALLEVLKQQGILRPLKDGDTPNSMMFGERELAAKVVETSPAKIIMDGGKVVRVPATRALIPEAFWHELKPILDPAAKMPPGLAKRIIHFINEMTLSGPAEAVIHSHNLLGTLIANTPFLGEDLATKTIGNTPFTKTFTAIVKLCTTDPMGDLAAKDLQEMAQLGLLPERFGTETYSAEYAERTGAELKRLPFSWGPLLYGPKGIDVRARLLMYRLAKQINPNASPLELYKFVNQLGLYTEALQGHLERSLKSTGFSRFVTAGSTMLRNGIDAWLGTGSGSGPGGGKKNRLAQMLSGGAVGLLAAWVLAYRAYTGKWPWDDKRSKLLKIPASDAARHSAIGVALWGKDFRKVGYINFGFFSPLVSRGARGLGVDGGYNTVRAGGNLAQVGHSVERDMVNSVLHPVMGPAARTAMVGLTGKQPFLVDDSQGGSKFLTALPRKAPLGSEILMAAKQLNSFYGNVGAATGFGTTDDERGASASDIILKSVIEMTGLVSPGSNPNATQKALAVERRIHRSR